MSATWHRWSLLTAIDGDYFEFLFDVFGKNLVRFKYHDGQANSNDCNFEPLVFAAALQKVRGTLEELEIRADELWGDVTIGSLQDFPRLKRITISRLLLIQYETEARLIDKLLLGLSYLFPSTYAGGR